jgi:hypothetical protein
MTLTEKDLRKTAEQRQIILERFEAEPEPYEWSEQDIAEQIDRVCLEHPAPQPKAPVWA